MKDDIQPLTPGQLEIARKLEESCEATTLYPQRYVDALNKEIRTLTVQCPLCGQPARVLYQSEICQWGDNADNSTKGWQCGCDRCDHLFFVSRKQMALNAEAHR